MNIEKKQIIVVGDTHGDTVEVLTQANNQYQDTLFVHIGDLGMGFGRMDKFVRDYQRIDGMLQEQGNMLAAIRGNHDNPDYWKNPEFKRRLDAANVILVRDYDHITINGVKCLFVGGAISIDRFDRAPMVSWWVDEEVGYPPPKDFTADVLFCHTAPTACPPHKFGDICFAWFSVDPGLPDELKVEREILQKVAEQAGPRQIYYGHFHDSANGRAAIGDVEAEYKMLNINELHDATERFALLLASQKK